MKLHAKKIMRTAILLALALIIGLIENALPPILPTLPFAKLGISNIAVLITVLFVNIPYAYLVVVLKCVFVALFNGNMSSILYSLPAGVVSLSVMTAVLACKKFSLPAVSVCGALSHNITQIAVASVIVGNSNLWILLPYFATFGCVAGFLTGCLSYLLVKKLPFK